MTPLDKALRKDVIIVTLLGTYLPIMSYMGAGH